MDRNLALEALRVTEAAALAAARWMGKGDGKAAELGATEAMRKVFDSIYFKGTIVIGEGPRGEAPVLFVGEDVGCGKTPEVDIAVDPLECKRSVAFGRSNAMSVVAMAPKGDLLLTPDTYMEKIAVGPEAAGVVDLNLTVEENLHRIAEAKDYDISELTVALLDRDRHEDLIARVRKLGARIQLIPDGDVAAAIAAALPGTGIDVLIGIGGASEGILSAAALRCIGGELQARLVPRNHEEIERARAMGITDINHIFTSAELAKGDHVMFSATGVTDGDLLNGVRYRKDGATTHSLVMRSSTKTRRFIVTEHYFEGEPKY
jgi:fructose-1,6-bisphosphatase II